MHASPDKFSTMLHAMVSIPATCRFDGSGLHERVLNWCGRSDSRPQIMTSGCSSGESFTTMPATHTLGFFDIFVQVAVHASRDGFDSSIGRWPGSFINEESSASRRAP